MRRLLLVRHAQSVWNAEGRWQGSADPDLSTVGRLQAAEAAEGLGKLVDDLDLGGLAGLWSSDLRRAVHTAATLGAAAGWTDPPVEVPELREHGVGLWSGLTRPEIEQRWPGMLEAWSNDPGTSPPGGELRQDFEQRVAAALDDLCAAAPEGLGLVVTHGGVLRSLGRRLGLAGQPVSNLAGYLVDADGPRHLDDVALVTPTPAPVP